MPRHPRSKKTHRGDASHATQRTGEFRRRIDLPRAFGARGGTPILLMHGANYFDSYDWIGVAEALAADREVATFDKRGFGESGWSPSKDYSLDANMGDILAVIGE